MISNNNTVPWIVLTSFVAGIATSMIAFKLLKDDRKNRKNGEK